MLRILGIVILAIAAGGGYYGYTNYFRATTVTTSVAMSAPVSEAIYGTGTVEPARWAKVLPLAAAPAGRSLHLRGADGEGRPGARTAG